MGSHRTWSISLGRWGGLQIRIHGFFLLFALLTLFLGWHAHTDDALKIAGGSLCILLVSVFLHELGHYLAALRLGGDGSEMVLGPLGRSGFDAAAARASLGSSNAHRGPTRQFGNLRDHWRSRNRGKRRDRWVTESGEPERSRSGRSTVAAGLQADLLD